VAELEISWASGEREETDWIEKEPEGEVEEQEPYHLLPEPKELETEPRPSLPEPDEQEREQEFQLMMEKLNSTLSRALERGQRRRRRR
jgi:hypothetical protein